MSEKTVIGQINRDHKKIEDRRIDAAIRLQVPASGVKIINDIIKIGRRERIATAAMTAILTSNTEILNNEKCENIAFRARKCTDLLIKELDE